MWLTVFLMAWLQTGADRPATPALDAAYFKAKVEPLLLEKRPGHARCVVCHSTGTAFRLQPPTRGGGWTDEQSQKNFEMASKFVTAGHPETSRLLLMPLSHEAGGTEFHPGGKHWTSKSDPEWKILADWVNGAK